jgi:hypothetical protein
MYRIVGADQKQYGPISADQIRQWIAEGRVNAQTQVCAEGTQEWKPLALFPEFGLSGGAVSGAVPGEPTGPPPSQDEILARDYSLDIGRCISRAWEITSANFWPVVGVSFLVLVVQSVVNQLLGLISRPAMNAMVLNHEITAANIAIVLATNIPGMPLTAILMGGLFRYYLKLIRKQNATIGDAFSGFSNGIGQLALFGLVQGILVTLGFVLCVIPGIYLAVAWYFGLLLIADKGLPFWEAMEFSRKTVSKHWFVVFGFLLVVGLLAALGLIACCIGVFVTCAVAFLAVTFAYEDIFGRKTA